MAQYGSIWLQSQYGSIWLISQYGCDIKVTQSFMNLSRAFCPFSNDYYDFWKFKNPICLSLDQLSPGSLVCEPYKHFPQLMALEAFKTSVITLPSSALAPATALPELVLVPDYPGRPRIVLFVNFREKLRKQKLLVYIRRPQNSF